jgi:putative phosphoesterase
MLYKYFEMAKVIGKTLSHLKQNRIVRIMFVCFLGLYGMKIIAISDIHSNRVALDAVLTDIQSESYDLLVCCGDVIGYYPWPTECVERIRDTADVTIQGNHDRDVSNYQRYTVNKQALYGLEYSEEQLTENQIDWLSSRPETRELPQKTIAVHSHPENTDEYVPPRKYNSLEKFASKYSIILLGHTHIQSKDWLDNSLIVNPGSVGQPRDGDSKAAYAVIDTTRGTASLRRVEYDIDSVYEKVQQVQLPEEAGQRLYAGR